MNKKTENMVKVSAQVIAQETDKAFRIIRAYSDSPNWLPKSLVTVSAFLLDDGTPCPATPFYDGNKIIERTLSDLSMPRWLAEKTFGVLAVQLMTEDPLKAARLGLIETPRVVEAA